jgi:MtN3 and saliva related transmembrane protein
LDFVELIGFTAGAMGGFSLFPQVLKVLKTKSTKDISREMFFLLAGSIFLWLVYGIFLKNLPIMIANFFGLIQALVILYFKIENQLKKRTPIQPSSPLVLKFNSKSNTNSTFFIIQDEKQRLKKSHE